MKELIKSDEPIMTKSSSQSAFELAEAKLYARLCKEGSRKEVELFLKVSNLNVNKKINRGIPPFEWTGLMFACRNLNFDIVQLLLEKGADPNFSANGFTPIIAVIASSNENTKDSSVKCSKLLVKAGVKIPGTPMLNGRTLLTRAVRKRALGLVNYFLEVGADPNQRDGGGETPLNIAVSMKLKEIAECLIKHGANPFIENVNGESCLDLALKNSNDGDNDMGEVVTLWRMDYYEKHYKSNKLGKRRFSTMIKQVNTGCYREEGSYENNMRSALSTRKDLKAEDFKNTQKILQKSKSKAVTQDLLDTPRNVGGYEVRAVIESPMLVQNGGTETTRNSEVRSLVTLLETIPEEVFSQDLTPSPPPPSSPSSEASEEEDAYSKKFLSNPVWLIAASVLLAVACFRRYDKLSSSRH